MGTPPDGRTRAAPGGKATLQPHTDIASIDGSTLRSSFTDACALLKRHIAALNAINVFPVPDGDTGANMHLTLREGVRALAATEGDNLAEAVEALAHGTLMGARGNSGVILSQILRGLATGLAGRREADGPALAAALSVASEAAYGALSEPVEGTILTVIQDSARSVADEPPATVDGVLERAVAAAKQAVDRTPELLPQLKEAGVVDAGGLGLAIILEGVLRSLRGDSLDVDLAPDVAVEAGWRSEAASLHQAEHGVSGYCTEFIVEGEKLEPAAARERLGALGTSLLVVGGDGLLRVHLHTKQPDEALAYGRTVGELSQVKVDNLEAQIQRFVSDQPTPTETAAGLSVVAVVAGEGIEAAFRSVGVADLVRGGQTMNPSAGEILEAIESCAAEQIAVLPNNKNIIAAAQQAAEESTKQVTVVPSRSIPQGIAAVLALTPDLSFEANTAMMERALASVRSAEVTRAVRATTIEGKRIELGQAVGVVDGAMRVVADDIDAAVRACVEAMRSPDSSLLTLYAGEDVRDEDAERLVEALGDHYPDVEVELVRGGQPHYPYLLSLE